jgi:dTDP-4-dehydrorhamnose 3,5-epimerase
MEIHHTELPGVLILEPRVFRDPRGFFLETFRADRFAEALGTETRFVQDNHSRSTRGVLRGLHFQYRRPQGKLVYCGRGEIFDVAVDLDPRSPTCGRWVGARLSDENQRQMYVPPGYAHGFQVLSDVADVHYKCTDYYDPGGEGGLRWDDPTVAIDWPLASPLLSERDRHWPELEKAGEALTRARDSGDS